MAIGLAILGDISIGVLAFGSASASAANCEGQKCNYSSGGNCTGVGCTAQTPCSTTNNQTYCSYEATEEQHFQCVDGSTGDYCHYQDPANEAICKYIKYYRFAGCIGIVDTINSTINQCVGEPC